MYFIEKESYEKELLNLDRGELFWSKVRELMQDGKVVTVPDIRNHKLMIQFLQEYMENPNYVGVFIDIDGTFADDLKTQFEQLADGSWKGVGQKKASYAEKFIASSTTQALNTISRLLR